MSLLFFVCLIVLNVFGSYAEPIISGQGDYVFQYDPDAIQTGLFKLMDRAQLLNGHGLCKDRFGNLYFTFQPAAVTPTTQALISVSKDLQKITLIGDPKLSPGVPHGLRIEYDEDKKDSFLYHANNAAIITKTTLSGEVIWMSNFTNWQTLYPQYWPLRPTDAVAVPGTNILLVADGYGSSYIHMLDKNNGEYLKKSWGGQGDNNNPLKLNTPHGINLDPLWNSPTPTFVISDRSNHRLVWASYDGQFLAEENFMKSPPYGMSLPCNVDITLDPYTNETVSVIPSLGDSYQNAYINGSVAIYGSQTNGLKLLSVIEVEKFLGDIGHQHPHDAVLLANGDLVVCCWSGPSDGPQFGPAKGTISYWRRIWKPLQYNN